MNCIANISVFLGILTTLVRNSSRCLKITTVFWIFCVTVLICLGIAYTDWNGIILTSWNQTGMLVCLCISWMYFKNKARNKKED